MTESEVIRLLVKYCRERDLRFFAHVKTGSYYMNQQRILDGFAIAPQYAKTVTYGYEIKVSRSDFLRDKKWQEYLPVCSKFYFVCPVGIIKKEDLPDGIGLIYANSEHVEIIKNARKREIEEPALTEILKYLVFYRCLSEREKVNAAVKHMNRAERDFIKSEKELRDVKRNYQTLQHENFCLRRGIPV